jgi:hypothetical protein
MTKGCTHERDKDLAMKMLEQSNFSVVSMNLANLLGSTGRYQESLDRDLAGLAALNRLDARTDSLLFRAQSYTASLCEKLRRPADAERYYQRALTTARRLFGPDEWWRMHLKCRPACGAHCHRRPRQYRFTVILFAFNSRLYLIMAGTPHVAGVQGIQSPLLA